jgi:hypothetical protein
MKGKIALLVGAAAGYVLGTRAGRERYDQMVSKAQSTWNNPKVQKKANQAQDFAKEKAPEVQHKVSEAASHAASAAKDKVGKSSDADAPAAAGSAGDESPSQTSPTAPEGTATQF